MKNKWYKSPVSESFGVYKTIKHVETGEVVLYGKKGQIWEWSKTHYAVLIDNFSAINRFAPDKNYTYKRGEERLIKVPKDELVKWVKILGVTKNREFMIKKANGEI